MMPLGYSNSIRDANVGRNYFRGTYVAKRMRSGRHSVRLLIVCLTVLLAGCSVLDEDDGDFESGDYFYYYQGSEVQLDRHRRQFLISFDSTIAIEDGLAHVAAMGIRIESATIDRTYLVLAPKGKDAKTYYTTYGEAEAQTLGDSSFVRFATPVFRVKDTNGFAGLTDQFAVGFSDDVDDSVLQQLLVTHRLERGFPALTWPRVALRVTKESSLNALDMANMFYRFDMTLASDPDFMVQLF